MIALIFDTETTGKAAFKDPHVAPTQPDLVQLGMLLIDLESGREYGSADLIIYPASWEVPQEVALIHGISHGMAVKFGVNLDTATDSFLEMIEMADVIVCHNTAFDTIIMRRAIARVCLSRGEEVFDPFEGKNVFCTMKAATPIVKKRGKRPLHNADYKWPKLSECIEFFFNEQLEGAHNAIVDCRATARILMEMVSKGLIEIPAEAAA